MEGNNIIHIRDYDAQGKAVRGRQRLIAHSQNLVERKVMAAVGVMLERVDDALFELANRASNTLEQNLYFDAMREMRIKRDFVKSEFRTKMLALFASSLGGYGSKTKVDDEFDLQRLSLMEDEDLEESLAVSNAVSKLSDSCHEALFALDMRMGCLLGDPDLENHVNPFGPDNICDAFRHACQSLESGIEVRLIIFKLFEKYLVTALDEAYCEINRYLLEHNILPDIKTGIRKSPSRSNTASDQVTAGAEDTDVFAALQQLLSTQHEQQHNTVAGAVSGTYSLSQVLSTLTLLQQAGLASLAEQYGERLGEEGTRANIVRILQDNGLITPANRIDAQTMDIVAMMFDYMLNDTAVPTAVKAELGRLQIPVLKVALLDKTLFSKKQHPVRRLLDGIAHAAVSWEAEAREELVAKVTDNVERIVCEFSDNLDVFETVLAEMEAFLARQEQESAGRQKRIAEILQSCDRIEIAKCRIGEVFTERMSDRSVPDFVVKFLLRYWSEVLLTTHLNEGEDSMLWHEQLNLVDDLINSTMPRQTAAERRELIGMLPRLLVQLKAGMKQIDLDEAKGKAFLSRLAKCHTRLVTSPAPAAANHPAGKETRPAPSSRVNAQPGTIRDDVFAQLQPDDEVEIDSEAPTVPRPDLTPAEVPFRDVLFYDQPQADRLAGFSSISDAVIDDSLIKESLETYFSDSETVMTMLNTSELAIEEIELIEETHTGFDPANANGADLSGGVPELPAAEIEQVKDLLPGTWLELVDEGGKPLRVCLQWVSESTNLLNFTDRRGRVAVRKSVCGLALDLMQGKARILSHTPLFERAVDSVFGRLRHSQSVPASG